MYNCDCYRIGGPFIGADPNCPAHGVEAQARSSKFEQLENRLLQLMREDRLDPEVCYVLTDLLEVLKER